MFGDQAGLGGHERSAFGSSSSTASDNLAQRIGTRIRTRTTKTRRRRIKIKIRIRIRMTKAVILVGTIPTTREISCVLPLLPME